MKILCLNDMLSLKIHNTNDRIDYSIVKCKIFLCVKIKVKPLKDKKLVI